MTVERPGAEQLLVVLEAGAEPGDLAMEREAELARAAREGRGAPLLLRLHGWASPVLTWGRTQRLPGDLPREAAGAGVALARRPTGGGWLLHLPGDLAVTLVLRGPLRAGELRGAARATGEAIAAALGALGVDAAAAPPAASPPGTGRADVCFQRVDREEVVAGASKVAGVALARFGRAALVQAAIPLVPARGRLAAFEARWDPRRREAVARTAAIDAGSLAAAVETELSRRLVTGAGKEG